MAKFRFTVGPWNVHEGTETFGPGIRPTIPFEEKIKRFAEIGMDGVQFHDDDAVPDMNNMSDKAIADYARDVKALLDKHGLFAEFVAPRLWFDHHTSDGAYTASRKEDFDFAMWRTFRSIDIARALGTNKIQLWLAREGTLVAEGKNPVEKILQLRDAINQILAYDPGIRVLIEPKPNEPVDRSYCGTAGHALAVGSQTADPSRVGLCIESAHSILSGLDPANDMALALAFGKLWGVHLNDQNGIRFDQDKTFGVENLRQAFNQVKVLYENNFGDKGECVGLDVKAARTQGPEDCYRHIINSKRIFELLLEKVKRFDYAFQAQCVKEQNLEKLEVYVMELLMGVDS
ncbi:MAG: TIM barrel protein [Eubacteriales bacterium]|nr:TIM barrel protein [Eubacteriales bacterium]MDD3109234.1 TIM barrel protein [Eubacteriales bacterium]MDD3571880.1 TIM barrel protein [Eubacteriales bacterium]MDD4133966.1 TIM barrel protein [Eubacteriales bacterium]